MRDLLSRGTASCDCMLLLDYSAMPKTLMRSWSFVMRFKCHGQCDAKVTSNAKSVFIWKACPNSSNL